MQRIQVYLLCQLLLSRFPKWSKGHRHSFSFDQNYDPRFMGFRSLRVINEDWVQPGHGFPIDPHRDMEIITYLLEALSSRKDSLGNDSIIRPGDGQRMSAGTGVRHSEANPSQTDPAHLLQIWILPERRGIEPGYEQKEFPSSEKRVRYGRPYVAKGSVELNGERLHQGEGAAIGGQAKLEIEGREDAEILLFDLA